MRYFLTLSINFLIPCFLLFACGKSDDPTPTGSTDNSIPAGSPECTENITYSTNIQPLVMKTCAVTGCHTTGGYKDFTSYSKLKAQIELEGAANFMARIEPGGGMPPSYSSGPNLTDCEREQFRTWLQAGYLNN